MKTHVMLTLFFWCSATIAYSQVGIMTNNPNKDAALDLNNSDGINTKGLLLPKVALTGTNSFLPMSAFVAGMKVYNTANTTGTNKVTAGVYYSDGFKWIRENTSLNSWTITGDLGTNATANFIGTTDAVDFVSRTNNTEAMRVRSTGQWLIGTNTVPTGGTNVKLVVNNATTAGTLQIIDGTQATNKVLISDANGLASWGDYIPDIFEDPNFGSSSTTGIVMTPSSDPANLYYSGNTLTLPPGTWKITLTFKIAKNDNTYLATDTYGVRLFFSDAPTVSSISADAMGSTFYSPFSKNTAATYATGVFFLKNSTSSNKVYYLNGSWYNAIMGSEKATIVYPVPGAYENRLIAEKISL